ncbi:MAG: aldehyde dehydrogenase family protein, partial [Candidatus Thermoplasmatota archaeon]|nr:aldehyde dehydrogenase family protein [Candidatus Thermoplasmatota archaeon]
MAGHPSNEPILGYTPGSPERDELQAEMDRQTGEVTEIPCIINGEEIYTGITTTQTIPHDHGHVLANVHLAGREEMEAACAAAVAAQATWIDLGLEGRCAVFERCADLLAGDWRMRVNAATMLDQSKTAFQAEIDAACELIDFWRFNVRFLQEMYESQPISSAGCWNRLEHRPLDGFVFAITPFNFTSIAGNL